MATTQRKKADIVSSGSGLSLGRGRRLGKYRLEKRLGTGGFCEVWQARDSVEGIRVALKIPLASRHGERDNSTLLREVRLVAQLRHEHILPVKNADIIDGYAVLATELSVGTLDDRSKPMAPRRIFSIIAQVLDGLAYAHQHRLVHCDVNPNNIFLFPDGRAALGDFGIGLQVKGRMGTVDEYGTPGYVAPEQAYGRPTYRSDCFSVALILYEYLTGSLPRWPFGWPPRGYVRLRECVNPAVIRLLKQSLSVDPAGRCANASQMLDALVKAAPDLAVNGQSRGSTSPKKLDWRKLRRQAFGYRYGKILHFGFACLDCGEPIAEEMEICPWCGSDRNRFDTRSQFSHICRRCHKGMHPAWRFCPWCYGAGYEPQPDLPARRLRYHARCRHCGGKLARFMRYCPWCRHKVRKPWRVSPFPELCGRCGWSIDSAYWNYCPWCTQRLIH
ncbi:MAG: protein kinase [Sedimentisphaerales bacterium]|nr:protein kinase [Sedimentisphaerales bacterium]